MDIVLSIATAVLVVATLLPLWRNPHWIVRSLDFPRLQLAVAAFLVLLLHALVLSPEKPYGWILVGLTLFCLAWQLWWIMPYTVLWPTEAKTSTPPRSDRTLSILTANVLTPNRQAGLLLELVRHYQPDVLVTLESDQWWQSHLDTLEADMPYTMKCPKDNLYGMHVYSRLPLEDTEITFLVEDDIPSMHAGIRLRTGDLVRAHFLHPTPPRPGEENGSANRDAELVIVARSVAGTTQPVIVTGDLNDVAWSSTTRLFRKLSGLLDPRVGRGIFNTFHAGYPFLRWPLDHLFHSRHFTVRSIKRLPYIGSDHFPLWAELSFSPELGENQEGLEADSEDESRAQSIAAKQGADANDVPSPGAGLYSL